MRYMILIYQDESKMAAVPKDAVTQMSSAYVDYTEAMKKAGTVNKEAVANLPEAKGTPVFLTQDQIAKHQQYLLENWEQAVE